MLSGIGPFFILPAQKNEFRQLSPISVVPALPPGTRFFFRDSVRYIYISRYLKHQRVFALKKVKHEVAAQRRPACCFLEKPRFFRETTGRIF